MRLPLALTIVVLALAPATVAPAAEPARVAVDLSGAIDGRGLLIAESDKPVYRLQLTAQLDKNGEGSGTLVLDPSPPAVDEFGFAEPVAALPAVKLECSIKFVKKKIILMRPAGGPHEDVEWRLFEITGPKITSRLTLATEWASHWSFGRILVSDKEGKGRLSVNLHSPPIPLPCHPGCFPAGTPILVPGGTRAVDSLRAGDGVVTVGPDGVAGLGTVAAVYVTRNRLIEVRTDGSTLVTTETQPLAFAGGGLRAAGELKAGDRIHSWDGRERRTVTVRSVTGADRDAPVFNLVLGEPVLFVADGFLARSKPPAPPTDPTKP